LNFELNGTDLTDARWKFRCWSRFAIFPREEASGSSTNAPVAQMTATKGGATRSRCLLL
jgi:hypothetical protein